jgi:ABC-2 type transport system ATP-binding protein
MKDTDAIVAEGLSKQYGDVSALRDVSFSVSSGSVLGLLGHNGAGKTTAIRILTTLAEPTSGKARVAGFDVASEGARVRERIGVAGQAATVDDLLTARANLEMVGRLYHLPKAEVRSRADELLERLGLADVGDRLVKTFSGGMRRRLDLAASLVADPPVLFLDEPTTGLDPEARIDLWDLLRELVRGGTTLLLTTQYLDEADQLADSIVVLDRGRVIEEGSPAELKSRVGGERVVINVSGTQEIAPAASALARFADGHIDSDPDDLVVTAPVRRDTRLIEVVRALDQEGIDAADVHRREPTLDDVFLTLTGTRRAEPAPTDEHELEEVAA